MTVKVLSPWTLPFEGGVITLPPGLMVTIEHIQGDITQVIFTLATTTTPADVIQHTTLET